MSGFAVTSLASTDTAGTALPTRAIETDATFIGDRLAEGGLIGSRAEDRHRHRPPGLALPFGGLPRSLSIGVDGVLLDGLTTLEVLRLAGLL